MIRDKRIINRADRAFHSVSQTFLSEFGSDQDLYPDTEVQGDE